MNACHVVSDVNSQATWFAPSRKWVGREKRMGFYCTSFQIVASYTLQVHFDDDTYQIINFEPVLFGEQLRPLRDLALFNQVRIDPEVQTLIWPNGADFDPATLHDWPEHVVELSERASEWEAASII